MNNINNINNIIKINNILKSIKNNFKILLIILFLNILIIIPVYLSIYYYKMNNIYLSNIKDLMIENSEVRTQYLKTKQFIKITDLKTEMILSKLKIIEQNSLETKEICSNAVALINKCEFYNNSVKRIQNE